MILVAPSVWVIEVDRGRAYTGFGLVDG